MCLMRRYFGIALCSLLAGCVPVVEYVATDIQIKTNASPKIIEIRNTANTIEITTHKQIYGQPLLVTEHDETVSRKYKASGKSVLFSYDNQKFKHGCYKIIIIANVKTYLTPSGREFKSDWCFKNKLRERFIDVSFELEREDRKLFELQQNYDQKSVQSAEFSNQCQNPQPVSNIEPAPFCSNKSIVQEKLNQCDASLIARFCKVGAPILLNRELSSSQSRALTPACKLLADNWVGQETKASDLVYAQLKAELISYAGSFKEGLAWGVALFETYSCKGNIHSQCNPKQPTIPDCNGWENHSSQLSVLDNEIEMAKSNRASLATEKADIENEVDTISF